MGQGFRDLGHEAGAELAKFALKKLNEDPDLALQVANLVAQRMATLVDKLRQEGASVEQIAAWAEAATSAYSNRLDAMIALLKGATKGSA